MAVGQLLEASNEAFGEFRRRGLIVGIAVIDATTQRACLPRRASALRILPRARLPAIERPRSFGRPAEEKLDLEGRDEQGMSVLAEAAAPTAELTDWAEPGNLGVELVIERAKLSPVPRLSRTNRRNRVDCLRHSFWSHGNGRLDLGEGVEAAMPRAGTNLSNAVPILGLFHVLGPERPGSALDRPRRIDRAARLLVPEDTIATRLLDQAVAVPHPSDEPPGEFLDGFAAKLGKLLDLLGRDPHISGCPGAAVAASGARERQSVTIPRRIWFAIHS